MADDGRYRLAPLRDDRARAETASRGQLADAIDDAEARARSAVAAADRAAEVRARLDAALATPVGDTAARAAGRDRYAARLRGELDQAEAEHARRNAVHRDRLAVVDDARTRLAGARARRELVERHFQRWRDARRKLADRRAD